MWITNLTWLALKQILRHPVRSLLTVLGVGMGMFLFVSVETMQAGMQASTTETEGDRELVVFRKDRFCLFTSKMPEHYTGRMKQVPGVQTVIPIKVLLNSCGTSLDIVSLRGIDDESLEAFDQSFTIIDGDRDSWFDRRDAAIVGDVLATRRKLKVGDTFETSGVTVHVSAIMSSEDYQLKNVAFVHKEFLQRSSKDGLGIVTQFNVMVDPGADMKEVSKAIDAEFANDAEPTHTRSKKEFVAKTADELVRLIAFTRWVGLAAVLAVLGLVANTISMAVRGRVKENAVLQTVGYGTGKIIYLVVVEGVILACIGGLIATGSVFAFLHFGNFSLTSEGATIVFLPSRAVFLSGMAISVALGLLAGLLPAYRASRQDIVNSLRMA